MIALYSESTVHAYIHHDRYLYFDLLLGSEVWIIEGLNNRGSDRNLSLRSDHSYNILINLGIFTAVGDSCE